MKKNNLTFVSFELKVASFLIFNFGILVGARYRKVFYTSAFLRFFEEFRVIALTSPEQSNQISLDQLVQQVCFWSKAVVESSLLEVLNYSGQS